MAITPLNDLTRLKEALPERISERDLRAARRATLNFFREQKEATYAWPDTAEIPDNVKWYISRIADEVTLKVYNEAITLIQRTDKHRANYRTLTDAPKNCGGFNEDTAILSGTTPFEQMVALDHVIDIKASAWRHGRRTLCLQQPDDTLIPVYISTTKKTNATVMTTILGTGGRGKFKVPTYTELGSDESVVESCHFVKPLEALEIVRQPYFSSATLIKSNAFAAGTIDNVHRFAPEDDFGNHNPFACVELKNQNKPSQSPTKERSAGCNILSLQKDSPEEAIASSLQYEDFSDEGYNDDADTTVTSTDYYNALEVAIVDRNMDELMAKTRALFVSHTGPFSSPIVNQFYAERLFANQEE